VAQLLGAGKLDKRLAAELGPSVVSLPTLADRAEDLRAMVLDALSQIGLGLRGEPLGIDNEGLRLIMEHDWPGNELELRSVLSLAVHATRGKVIGSRELLGAGLEPPRAEAAGSTPISSLVAPNSHRTPRRR